MMGSKVIAIAMLTIFVGAYPTHAQTAQTGVTLVSCSPNAAVAKDGTFAAKEGEPVIFKCTLDNKGTATVSVLLSGERTRENASDQASPVSVSSAVSVPPKGTVVSLPFVAVFESGTYQYTITTRNVADGKSFGSALTFTSTLGGSSARFTRATFDGRAFASGKDALLTVTIGASPTRVTTGGSTTVTATVANVDSCDITKNGTAWQTFVGNPSGSVTESFSDTNITSQNSYALTCTNSGSSVTATATQIVNVVSTFKEF